MGLEPDYGQTLVSDEEVDALTPAAREILGDPIRKADLFYLEQTGLEPLLAYDWEVDRRTYIRLLREYDETRDASSLAEFIPVVSIEDWTTE